MTMANVQYFNEKAKDADMDISIELKEQRLDDYIDFVVREHARNPFGTCLMLNIDRLPVDELEKMVALYYDYNEQYESEIKSSVLNEYDDMDDELKSILVKSFTDKKYLSVFSTTVFNRAVRAAITPLQSMIDKQCKRIEHESMEDAGYYQSRDYGHDDVEWRRAYGH